MSTKAVKADREKFDRVRAAIVKARAERDAHDIECRVKWGAGWEQWGPAGARHKRERLGAALDRARNRMFALLEKISPRDWTSGVPVQWVAESLTFEDAVRPTTEALSVPPPLAYGCAASVDL